MKRGSRPSGLPKARNPIAMTQVMGKGGAHQKTKKALRQAERQDRARRIRSGIFEDDPYLGA